MRFGRKRGGGAPRRRSLETWKAAQVARRARLAKAISSQPGTPRFREKLNAWVENLKARKAWLQARLENVDALEKLLQGALNDEHTSPSQGEAAATLSGKNRDSKAMVEAKTRPPT